MADFNENENDDFGASISQLNAQNEREDVSREITPRFAEYDCPYCLDGEMHAFVVENLAGTHLEIKNTMNLHINDALPGVCYFVREKHSSQKHRLRFKLKQIWSRNHRILAMLYLILSYCDKSLTPVTHLGHLVNSTYAAPEYFRKVLEQYNAFTLLKDGLTILNDDMLIELVYDINEASVPFRNDADDSDSSSNRFANLSAHYNTKPTAHANPPAHNNEKLTTEPARDNTIKPTSILRHAPITNTNADTVDMSDRRVAGKLSEIFEAVLNNIALGKDALSISKDTATGPVVDDNKSGNRQLTNLPKYTGVKYIHGKHRSLEWIHSFNNCAFSNNVTHDTDKIKWFYKAIDMEANNRFIAQWYSNNTHLKSYDAFMQGFIRILGLDGAGQLDDMIADMKNIVLIKGLSSMREHTAEFKMRVDEICLLYDILIKSGRSFREYHVYDHVRQLVISLAHYPSVHNSMVDWHFDNPHATLETAVIKAISAADRALHYSGGDHLSQPQVYGNSAQSTNQPPAFSGAPSRTDRNKYNPKAVYAPVTITPPAPAPTGPHALTIKPSQPLTTKPHSAHVTSSAAPAPMAKPSMMDSLTQKMNNMKIHKVDTSQNVAKKDLSRVKCYVCGGFGHYATDRDTGARCALPPTVEFKGYLAHCVENEYAVDTLEYNASSEDEYRNIYFNQLDTYDHDSVDGCLKIYYFSVKNNEDTSDESDEDF